MDSEFGSDGVGGRPDKGESSYLQSFSNTTTSQR